MKENKASNFSELSTVPAKAIQIQIRVSHNYKNVFSGRLRDMYPLSHSYLNIWPFPASNSFGNNGINYINYV